MKHDEEVSTMPTLIEYDRVAAPRARHDSLLDQATGLPRWELLIDRLEVALCRAGATGNRVALFLVFAEGGEIGDAVAFADRLRDGLPEGDTLARIGLSDFAVLSDGVRTHGDAARIAQGLGRGATGVRCRLGYVVASPGQAADDLIRQVVAITDGLTPTTWVSPECAPASSPPYAPKVHQRAS
jgi:GGDEF domain-containing protein